MYAMKEELERLGLKAHEVEEAATSLSTLGWELDGDSGWLRGSQKRRWKMQLGIKALLDRGTAPEREIEALTSRFTFIALARRPALAIFSSGYRFMRESYLVRKKLPPQVRKELGWARGLLPVPQKDLRAEWSRELTVVDASAWCGGVYVKQARLEATQDAGRNSERWRYRRTGTLAVQRQRAHALAKVGRIDEKARHVAIDAAFEREGGVERWMLEPGGAQKPEYLEADPEFPDVEEELWGGDWKFATSTMWKDEESQVMREARALLLGVRRICRGRKHHGKHVVM